MSTCCAPLDEGKTACYSLSVLLTHCPCADNRLAFAIVTARVSLHLCVTAGARIASTVISRPELFAEWNKEMDMMAGRIKARCTF